MDVDEEFKKLDEAEVKKYEQNDEIKSLLTSVHSAVKYIKIAGKSIRIKAYMPKATRKKFVRASKEYSKIEDAEEIERIEHMFYPIVAEMCLDPPYNDAKTWQYIDEQESCIQDVAVKILAEVNQTDANIKSFR